MLRFICRKNRVSHWQTHTAKITWKTKFKNRQIGYFASEIGWLILKINIKFSLVCFWFLSLSATTKNGAYNRPPCPSYIRILRRIWIFRCLIRISSTKGCVVDYFWIFVTIVFDILPSLTVSILGNRQLTLKVTLTWFNWLNYNFRHSSSQI